MAKAFNLICTNLKASRETTPHTKQWPQYPPKMVGSCVFGSSPTPLAQNLKSTTTPPYAEKGLQEIEERVDALHITPDVCTEQNADADWDLMYVRMKCVVLYYTQDVLKDQMKANTEYMSVSWWEWGRY